MNSKHFSIIITTIRKLTYIQQKISKIVVVILANRRLGRKSDPERQGEGEPCSLKRMREQSGPYGSSSRWRDDVVVVSTANYHYTLSVVSRLSNAEFDMEAG